MTPVDDSADPSRANQRRNRNARRFLGPAIDPELAGVYADLKLAGGLGVILVFCTVGFLICLGFWVFGGAGTWLDDNVGEAPLGGGGVAVLGGVTLLIGLAHRWLHNRLLHHPRYGKEPRLDR